MKAICLCNACRTKTFDRIKFLQFMWLVHNLFYVIVAACFNCHWWAHKLPLFNWIRKQRHTLFCGWFWFESNNRPSIKEMVDNNKNSRLKNHQARTFKLYNGSVNENWTKSTSDKKRESALSRRVIEWHNDLVAKFTWINLICNHFFHFKGFG